MDPPPALPPRPTAPPPPPSRQPSRTPPPPYLAPNLPNDELYSLLRRFNKQVTTVRRAHVPPTRLDFEPAKDEQFDPDRLRANVERIYLTVVRDCMVFGKEMMVLRSWEDPLRTGGFASAYFFAWSSPFGVTAFLFTILALLILYPSFRTALFPPLPTPRPSRVLVDKPPRDPTLSNAEQDERDAVVFAEGMAQLAATSSGAGHMSGGEPSMEDVVHEAIEDAEVEAEVEAEGESTSEDHKASKKDKKKKEKTDKLAKVGLPLQQFTGDFADSWERWGNALSPTSPPLHPNAARRKVALHVLPLILLFGFFPWGFVSSALGFVAGVGFFGGPLITLFLALLDEKFEGWKEALELRHSMLNLVPSNTQLTIALLREAEAAGNPLPPPPPPPLASDKAAAPAASTAPPLPPRPLATNGTQAESASAGDEAAQAQTPASAPISKKTGKEKFANFVKSATKLTETGAGYVAGEKKLDWEKVSRVAVDKIKATTGSELPEHLMSIAPRKTVADSHSNSTFLASSSNTPGHLLLVPPIHPTSLTFRPLASGGPSSHLVVSIPLASVTMVRKTAGLGWKGRLALGWSTGVSSVGDGIRISWTEKDEEGAEVEQEKSFGGLVRRDELYNRIISCAEGRFVLL
ncbi:hypothetical protein BCR35DRAFT_301509 [Leucosporidium creatinivorum]|uniref:Uncharacterized protein n=1 Tax=Leucosporidium creatinivorum TaxID=106004 RepID=A0A1Y2FYW8_9BASI|nr:hypothetical protein BCR35DRAFT_301509 [Leucosporidium creatinivorum]